MLEEKYNADHTSPHKGVEEMLGRRDMIFLIFASVFALIAGAIRLTRASNASTIDSFRTYVESEDIIGDGAGIAGCNSFCGRRSILGSFTTFWGKIPRRFWNFFIDAFIIPSYKKEWGKYRAWSFRAKERPKKSLLLRALIQSRKRRRQDQESQKKSRVIPHNHLGCQRVRINIGGMCYETQLKTLERFPDTLLGDAKKGIQYFDPVKQEYYFDRNRGAFEAVLDFYQTGGRFRRPDNVQADVLLEDAHFYQLNPAVIEQFQIEEGLSSTSSKQEIVPQNLLCRKIWLLFDFPESSLQAGHVAVLSTGALFLSMTAFCMETLDSMEIKPDIGITDKTKGRIGFVKSDVLVGHDALFLTETMCNIWFIVEFFMRFFCCPFYWKFLKNPLNLIDLIALVPFFISLTSPLSSRKEIEEIKQDPTSTATDSLYLLRIVRVVRVFRIFKLSRHSRGLKILGKTLVASLNELILLFFLILLGVVLFSSAMYFAEIDDPNTKYHSIPAGFWWAVITVYFTFFGFEYKGGWCYTVTVALIISVLFSLVGFGDVVPKTILGQVVGTFCAVAGVLTIALPVPVIVSNFNFFYHQAIDESDLRFINIHHVPACPYRSAVENDKSGKNTNKNSNKKQEYSSDEEFGSLKIPTL